MKPLDLTTIIPASVDKNLSFLELAIVSLLLAVVYFILRRVALRLTTQALIRLAGVETVSGLRWLQRSVHALLLGLLALALVQLWEGEWAWFGSLAVLLGRISAALLLVVGASFAWTVLDLLVQRWLTGGADTERASRLATLIPLVRHATLTLVIILAVMMILSELGVDIAPLLAGAGVIGLAIGVGAQALVRDVVAGLFILLEDKMRLHDRVIIKGLTGTVDHLSVTGVRLKDDAGVMHYIPYGVVDVISLTPRSRLPEQK